MIIRLVVGGLKTIPILILSMSAFSQPVIDSVVLSGDTGSQTLIISGANFGQGPNVVLYDTFENGTAGKIVSGDNASVNGWYDLRAKYSNLSSKSGGQSALVAEDQTRMKMVFGVSDSDGMHGLKHFTEVYFSYSIKDLGVFPGAGGTTNSFSTQSATKDAWMMFGARGDNTGYSVNSLGLEAGHDLYIPAWTGGGFNLAGNNTRMTPSFWQPDIKSLWAFGDWNTVSFHAKLDANNPYGDAQGFIEFMSYKGYSVNTRFGNFMKDQTAEGVSVAAWDRIGFMSWVRTGDGLLRVMDDIYVAIGENANARVLLTDARTIEASTKLMHLLPNSWESNEININYGDAGIYGDELKYIHVVDRNNLNVINGFLLPSPRAKAPTGLQVIRSDD